MLTLPVWRDNYFPFEWVVSGISLKLHVESVYSYKTTLLLPGYPAANVVPALLPKHNDILLLPYLSIFYPVSSKGSNASLAIFQFNTLIL